MFTKDEQEHMLTQLGSKLSLPRNQVLKRVVIPKLSGIQLTSAQKSGVASAFCLPQTLVKEYASLSTLNETTVQMWFKLSSASEDAFGGGVLFGVQNGSFSTGSAFVPLLYVSTDYTLMGGFWMKSSRESYPRGNVIGSSRLEPGVMYHASLVGDHDGYKLYLNGNLVKHIEGEIDMLTHSLSHGQIASGLCDQWALTRMNYFTNCYTFSGTIMDIQMYNKALSAQEIKETMWSSDVIPKDNRLATWRMFPKNYFSTDVDLKPKTIGKSNVILRNKVSLFQSLLVNPPTY